MMRTAPILVTIAGLVLAMAMTLPARPALSQFLLVSAIAAPAPSSPA